jgi:polyhydroxyalkanoate synthesis regulator phasin
MSTAMTGSQVLDELVDSNELSNDRADEAKRIYQELHTAALKAMASEKQRLDEAKVLKKRLEDENEAISSPPAQGEESDLQAALQVRQ